MSAITLERYLDYAGGSDEMEVPQFAVAESGAFHKDEASVEISKLHGKPLNLTARAGWPDGGRRVAEDLPTRHSLLSRLRDLGDNESWRVFFETYWRLIYNVARKSGLSDDAAQEVVQETVIAVARKIPSFRYDPEKGSFKNWLLLICRRRIQDHLRRVYSARDVERPENGEREMSERLVGAETWPDEEMDRAWDEAWRENILGMAVERVKQRANPKSFQVFDCMVLRNMRAAEVASMLGLSAAQVYLAKHRVSTAVKRAAREIEVELSARQGRK